MQTLQFNTDSLANAIESALTRDMMDPVIAAYADADGDVTFRHESNLVPSDSTAATEWDLDAYGDWSDYANEDGEITDPQALAREIATMCTDDPGVWLAWVSEDEEA